MSTLVTRVISALVAVAVLFSIAYFFQVSGLIVLTILAIIVSIYEYSQIAFKNFKPPQSLLFLFWICATLIFVALILNYELNMIYFAGVTCLFLSIGLWLTRERMQNEALLPALTMGAFGFLYVVLLPAFVFRTLLLPYGIQWFFALLVVVFLGDTFAYFAGSLFGKRKFMPSISPKKTVEGSIGGALGSILSGVIFAYFFLPQVPTLWMAGVCLLVAFVAQSGDLFASLLKRVAQVKDSGQIMPGHGGILDRIDGIFFAAPVIYAFARLFI